MDRKKFISGLVALGADARGGRIAAQHPAGQGGYRR